MDLTLYNFVKDYVRIKNGTEIRSFTDAELNELNEMQILIDNGYILRLVHLRKGGSKMQWYKSN